MDSRANKRQALGLSLGKKFSKYFLKEYGKHRWPRPKRGASSYTINTWTAQMFKILDKVADDMKLEWKQQEMLRIDRAYYKGKFFRTQMAALGVQTDYI